MVRLERHRHLYEARAGVEEVRALEVVEELFDGGAHHAGNLAVTVYRVGSRIAQLAEVAAIAREAHAPEARPAAVGRGLHPPSVVNELVREAVLLGQVLLGEEWYYDRNVAATLIALPHQRRDGGRALPVWARAELPRVEVLVRLVQR